MKLTIVTGLTALAALAFMVELLRRRQLQEKYAILWLGVSILMLPLGFFPTLADGVARRLGILSGVSLVLFLGIVFLLLVCVHLSWEVSRLEEETRTLAEDMALMRAETLMHVRTLAEASSPGSPAIPTAQDVAVVRADAIGHQHDHGAGGQ